MSLKLILAVGAAVSAAIVIPKAIRFWKTKLFVSYRYNHDHSMRRLLSAWSQNKKFKSFKFLDVSSDISIESDDDDVIMNEIRARIKAADIFVVLVSDQTHKGIWIDREIKAAKEYGKPIVAVKKNPRIQSPKALLGIGANWVYSFKFKEIRDAINSAT
jgi:hypothetical protein